MAVQVNILTEMDQKRKRRKTRRNCRQREREREREEVRKRKTRCRTWIKEGVSIQEMDKMEQNNCVGNEKRRGATSSMTTKQRPKVGGREKWSERG